MRAERKLRKINVILFLVSFIGLALSLYSVYVEHRLIDNPDALALCDISEHMSCSKAFGSKYGRGFGFIGDILGEESLLNLPNSIPGFFYYFGFCLLSVSKSGSVAVAGLSLGASIISMCMSVYLAYVLIFILMDFCIVCFTIHLVNLVLLIGSYVKS